MDGSLVERTLPALPPKVAAILSNLAKSERVDAFAFHAIVRVADDKGCTSVHDVAVAYRDDYLRALRSEGRDSEKEAGRLGLDEVCDYLLSSILPRLVEAGLLLPIKPAGERYATNVHVKPAIWSEIAPLRDQVAEAAFKTGEYSRQQLTRKTGEHQLGGSVLEAVGLTKIYKRRRVVNDVALRLQQGEIVGLLGPNGAGKTTTFYMIVGLIPPMTGRILLDGEDITKMPMFQRARRGIGYLSQEPSIFRKLSVEENILAILETLPLTAEERQDRLERLLDELNIKRLRKSKAYALSGGERRRLEITRALVTDPKFMMLDEPFAGVDPIAVHDIQTIVAGLRHRGIGVLISDHNVEQTLDIVDRAYIMFDGQVKVGGTVRDLVFDDVVADIYLGPTLTARLRDRFSRDPEGVPAQ
jgi:lipopolysaccharide export system ATP-binding protein